MTIKIGDALPSGTFKVMTADGPKPRTTDEIFKGRKVVLFGVPGAFTPTCHKNHLPGFMEKAAEFKAKGVQEIAVYSVNDVHVMGAWEKATGGAGKIAYLSDGNGDYASALGLELDATGGGLGHRVKRFAMLVDNGVVKQLNVEDNPSKADATSATVLLGQM